MPPKLRTFRRHYTSYIRTAVPDFTAEISRHPCFTAKKTVPNKYSADQSQCGVNNPGNRSQTTSGGDLKSLTSYNLNNEDTRSIPEMTAVFRLGSYFCSDNRKNTIDIEYLGEDYTAGHSANAQTAAEIFVNSRRHTYWTEYVSTEYLLQTVTQSI